MSTLFHRKPFKTCSKEGCQMGFFTCFGKLCILLLSFLTATRMYIAKGKVRALLLVNWQLSWRSIQSVLLYLHNIDFDTLSIKYGSPGASKDPSQRTTLLSSIDAKRNPFYCLQIGSSNSRWQKKELKTLFGGAFICRPEGGQKTPTKHLKSQ